ncbi:MAG: hypothetical protein LBQ46_02525 [Treponema sp.]|jgi:hypothetical protein|nr:hypothetical protein [Treponema sp.]
MKRAVLLPVLILALSAAWAQDDPGGDLPWMFRDSIPGGHRGRVSGIQYDGRLLLSVGEDGFLGIWDPKLGRALARFQLSGLPILTMACRPGKTQIACIEDDGLGQYRISVWDYGALKNLFTLRFRDPVQNISYSAGGSYLIISRSGRTGVVLLDPETGELLLDPRNTPEEFPSSAGLAVIGRTERVMLVYSPSGSLSYWELRKDGVLRLAPSLDDSGLPLEFDAPPDLGSPLLFGNNRFFAGFGQGGLVILRADTGTEIASDPSLTQGKLAARGDELYCLSVPADSPGYTFGGRGGIYRLRVNDYDRLERRGFYPSPAAPISALALIPAETAAAPPVIIAGSQEGELLPLNTGAVRPLETKRQAPVLKAAAGERLVAFLTGDGKLGYIPLDFLELENGSPLVLENAAPYTRITAAGSAPAAASGAAPPARTDRFLLWQDRSPLPYPALRSSGAGEGVILSNLGEASPASRRDPSSRGFPLRSVSVLEDQGLFLDTGGNISVLSLSGGQRSYTETSTGSMDAAFIDGDSIILARGSSGGAPFLKIDIRTRETVPIPLQAPIGAQVYRGLSGAVYGTALEETEGGLRTSIIRLDTLEPSRSLRLVEYQGEDDELSIAETDGFLASTLGGAAVYTPWGMYALERGPALVREIGNGDLYFIVLDEEGGISWHDPRTGEILALFRLYDDEWILITSWSRIVRGRVFR